MKTINVLCDPSPENNGSGENTSGSIICENRQLQNLPIVTVMKTDDHKMRWHVDVLLFLYALLGD